MHTNESPRSKLLNILAVTLLALELFGQFAFDAWYRRGTIRPEESRLAATNSTLPEGAQCAQPSQRALYD
jgi:hypothetical protein